MTGLAQEIARRLRGRLDALTDALVTDILAENPGYHDAALVTIPELRQSCRTNLDRVLQILGGMVPTGEDPYDAAVRTGTVRAGQRVPLASVLRSFRLGGRVMWRDMVRMAKRDDSLDRDQLLDVATTVWTIVDEVSSEVARAFHERELHLRHADEHRRHALVEDLLRGRGREVGFVEQAAAELGIPHNCGYLVVVAELASDGTPGLAMPRDSLAGYGVRSVWKPREQTTVGLVALERRNTTALLDPLRAGVRTRVGVSPVVQGLAEVGVAHYLARLALRTLPTDGKGLVELDERLPEALVARSPELADRLVHGVLGPLWQVPKPEQEVLLTTLAAWLATSRSTAATAERLYCHRNTVLNRLRRLESVLGWSLQDHEAGLTLSLALIAHAAQEDDGSAQR